MEHSDKQQEKVEGEAVSPDTRDCFPTSTCVSWHKHTLTRERTKSKNV